MAATPTSSISFQNFYTTTLTSPITSTALDIFLDVVPNGTEGFLVIDPDSTTNREIIYYNSKTATKVTCPTVADGRGQDDTTAVSHEAQTTVIMAPIAAYYETLLSLFQTTPQGWTSVATTVSSNTYNGNRSYTLSVNSDQTAIISNGMRLRTTRTVAAPTQCTSLNGTTQYYSKTSPAGMTFTDDFVAGAWVKLLSYGATGGVQQTIISRYNGTSGWSLIINSNGQPQLYATNAGAGNYRLVQAQQAIPLNKWVHVTAQLDMSSYPTLSTTTNYVMIDGVDVPSSSAQGGTNPSALVQAGNLEVGSSSGGLNAFPGKIAQAFVTSAKLTQTQVRSIYSQGLTASDVATYSIVSAYSFNNSINDINTTSANNLTANGSAVATNADSPFTQNAAGTPGGTYDYAIVTGITSSTITCQVPEGCTIPTSGGISAVSYSGVKAPYGFPTDSTRFDLTWYLVGAGAATTTGSIAGTWGAFSNVSFTVPIGSWGLQSMMLVTGSSTVGTFSLQTQWDTAAPTYTREGQHYERANVASGFLVHKAKHFDRVSVSTATVFGYYAALNGGAGTQTAYLETAGGNYLILRLTYL